MLPGESLIYTLTYTNAGVIAATGVVITETVPANTAFNAAASLPTIWSCAPGAPAGTACTTTIPGAVAGSGGTGSVTFAITVDDPLLSGVTAIANTAVIGDDGANGPDPAVVDNTGNATTPLDPTAITLVSFTAAWQEDTVVVQLGDKLRREIPGASICTAAATAPARAPCVSRHSMILHQGRGQDGAAYSWTDTDVERGQTYTYWLEETEVSGTTSEYVRPATADIQPGISWPANLPA